MKQNLSKQIIIKSGPKSFISFKGPLGFYENKEDGYTALQKEEKNKRKLNQI